MRFIAPAMALLATTTYALTTRDTNSDSVAYLESAASNMVSTLTQAQSKLQSLSTSGDPPPNGQGILGEAISNLENNFVEGITLFENIAQMGASGDAATMAQSMQTELSSLKSDFTSAQSSLSTDTTDNPITVNGVDALLGELIPGISDVFNEVADTLEALDLPPL